MTNIPTQTRTPIVPILLVFGAVVLGGIGYQIFRVTLADSVGKMEMKMEIPESTGNVFKDMAINHPKADIQRRNRKRVTLQQAYNAVPYPHNVQFGNPEAKVRLTVFTDIACGACRQEVQRIMAKVPLEKTHIILKHAPLNEGNIKSGLFEQMARQAGVLEAYHARINAESSDVSDKFMMAALNELGVSYKNQQEQLKKEPAALTGNLEKDIKQGDRAGLQELPTFFLNRYRIGPKTLPKARIKEYITMIDAGEPIYAVSK